MLKTKPFAERSIELADKAFDTELSGVMFNALTIGFDYTITGTGNVVPQSDAGFRALGATLELNQEQEPLIGFDPVDWYHLAAFANGAYPAFAAAEPGAGSAEWWGFARIPFGNIIPGLQVNASQNKAHITGTFNVDRGLNTPGNLGAIANGTFRAFVETTDRTPRPGGFLRPRFTRHIQDLTPSASIEKPFRFETDTLVAGFLLRQYHGNGAPAVRNVDGMVRRVRMDITRHGGPQEHHRLTWGQLTEFTVMRSSHSPAEYTLGAGVAFLPTLDEIGKPMFFRAGDSITIDLNCTAAAERQFTSINPAAGDQLYMNLLSGLPVRGTGDQPGSIRAVSRV